MTLYLTLFIELWYNVPGSTAPQGLITAHLALASRCSCPTCWDQWQRHRVPTPAARGRKQHPPGPSSARQFNRIQKPNNSEYSYSMNDSDWWENSALTFQNLRLMTLSAGITIWITASFWPIWSALLKLPKNSTKSGHIGTILPRFLGLPTRCQGSNMVQGLRPVALHRSVASSSHFLGTKVYQGTPEVGDGYMNPQYAR